MAVSDQINALAQSVYLAYHNRYFDDLTSDDGIAYIAQTIDWCNQLLGELELETDWNYLRTMDNNLGTISQLTQTFTLPTTVRKLVNNVYRPLKIMQDTNQVSSWDIVPPSMLTKPDGLHIGDRVTVVNNKIIFSRPLRSTELGGTILADTISYMPLLSSTDATPLNIVKPYQLLVFGIAKNATLPDIVQGGISPSMAQKYKDLLDKAVADNNSSAINDMYTTDEYGYIGGIYGR